MSDNTIHVSSTLRAMRSMMDSLCANTSSGVSFASVMQQTRDENSLDSYKASIADRIDLIPIDVSRVRDDITIDISDQCYEAMRDDPQYEKWVLDTVRSTISSENPLSTMTGGSLIQMRFGATRSQYRTDSWSKGDGFDLDSVLGNGQDEEDSYWDELKERAEKNREITEQIAAARARLRHANEIRKIQGKQQLTSTTDVTSEILTLLLEDFLG